MAHIRLTYPDGAKVCAPLMHSEHAVMLGRTSVSGLVPDYACLADIDGLAESIHCAMYEGGETFGAYEVWSEDETAAPVVIHWEIVEGARHA